MPGGVRRAASQSPGTTLNNAGWRPTRRQSVARHRDHSTSRLFHAATFRSGYCSTTRQLPSCNISGRTLPYDKVAKPGHTTRRHHQAARHVKRDHQNLTSNIKDRQRREYPEPEDIAREECPRGKPERKAQKRIARRIAQRIVREESFGVRFGVAHTSRKF